MQSLFERKRNLWILLGCIVLAILIFNPICLRILSVLANRLESVDPNLGNPEVYQPAALTLATYCQSDQSLFPEILSEAWLPQEVSNVAHLSGRVSTNSAQIGSGTRDYRFGYSLELDSAASIPATNVWKLYLVRTDHPDKLLTTLRLASAQHVSAQDLEKRLCAYFDEMISENQPYGYKGKIRAQLRFGEAAQAAATCEDWIKATPNAWLPRFTYAHVRCRLGETQAAAAQFHDWVKAHQAFDRDIYLALFNYREGLTNDAVEAVRMALSQPLVDTSLMDSPDEGANLFYLACNGGMIAYDGGDFDLCVSICDKMLLNKGDPYDVEVWGRQALRLKAAAMLMKGKQSDAFDLMKDAEAANQPDPDSHEANAKADRILEAAIRKNDTQFVRNPGNVADPMETWFNPFSADEYKWRSPNFGGSTPYPSSWKTDLINTNEPD